jgi:formylglycine-generating enzyme required for sulfatase activity
VDANGDGLVDADWVNRPVNEVSWGDAARFCNWLHNGQPTGSQDLTTTEDGSYYLNGAISDEALMAVVREPDATWVIPSQDEWYKAGYHKNDGTAANYWDYPTQSNTVPTAEAPPGTDTTNGSANYYVSSFVDPTHFRTEVGVYDAKPSDSPYGTYDQGGNIYEWTESPIIGTYRILRGGGCASGAEYLHAQTWAFYQPTMNLHGVGFRLALVVAPRIPTVSEWGVMAMTLLVLTVGTVVLTRRRVVSAR